MSKEKLFTDKRWTEPPQGQVIGHRELTEEEKKEGEEFVQAIKSGKISEWFNSNKK